MATESRRVQVTRRNLPPSGRQSLRRWSDRTRWKLGDREWFTVVEQALDAGNADLAHRVALNGVRVAIAETAAGATRHTAVIHVDPAAASRVPPPFDAASDGHAVAVTASGGETSAGVERVSPEHADLRQAAVADVVEPCAAPSVGTASGPAAPAASPSSPDVTSPARNEPLAAPARSHSRLEPAAPGTWADSFLVFVTRVLVTIGIVVVCAVLVAMLSAVTENALGRTSAGRLALAAAAAFFVAAVLAVRKPEPPRVSPTATNMADETAVATARPEPGSDTGTGTSWAVAGLLLVALAGGIQHYRLDRDVDSLKERAQLAANPRDMLTYLRALDANMVAHGATTGHTALLLKTPANDLSLHTRSVRSVIARLDQVQRLPPDAAAYQAALDDVRGVLREMPAIAGGLFWVQSGWWMSLVAFVCLVRLAAD